MKFRVSSALIQIVAGILAVFPLCAADPFTGVWVMNAGKSTFHASPMRSFRETIIEGDGQVRIRRQMIDRTGKAIDRTYVYVLDGKSHIADFEADASHSHHTIVCKRNGRREIERVTDHDHGKATTTNRHTLSADSKTITLVRSGSDDGTGKPYRDTLILEKQ